MKKCECRSAAYNYHREDCPQFDIYGKLKPLPAPLGNFQVLDAETEKRLEEFERMLDENNSTQFPSTTHLVIKCQTMNEAARKLNN